MSFILRIAKNSRSLAAADFSKKILIGVLFMIAARVLGKVVFGQYALIFTFVQMASLLAGSGLNTLAVRRVAQSRDCARSFFVEVTLLRVLCAVTVIALIPFIAKLLGFGAEMQHNLFWYSLTLVG